MKYVRERSVHLLGWKLHYGVYADDSGLVVVDLTLWKLHIMWFLGSLAGRGYEEVDGRTYITYK